MKHTNNDRRHILDRPMANAFAPGTIGDEQRKAMWAKRKAIGIVDPRGSRPPDTKKPTPFPGSLTDNTPTPWNGGRQLTQPLQMTPAPQAPATPITQSHSVNPAAATTPRQWGETRPGESYIDWQGPGNPTWERQHPEASPANQSAPAPTPSAPATGHMETMPQVLPPGQTPPAVPPPQPAAPTRTLGGSTTFDEKTGTRKPAATASRIWIGKPTGKKPQQTKKTKGTVNNWWKAG